MKGKKAERVKTSHMQALSSPTQSTRSTDWGQTNEHSLLLPSSPFIMLSRTLHCTAAAHKHTHTLWAAHAKRLVPTNVDCRYLTCTELQLHRPVSPPNTHSALQSTLIIPALLPVPSSLLPQWRQCACDKGFEGSFNSCSLFWGFGTVRGTKREFKPFKSWRC